MTTSTNKFFTSKEHYLSFRSYWAETVNSKNIQITGAHHILYNILRGKSFDHGFTPVTRTSKLQNGHYINQGLLQAYRDLKGMIEAIDNERNYHNSWMKTMLSIFQGTVTEDTLKMIELPECKPMESDYGLYGQVAKKIIDSDIKPISYSDIQDLYEITTQKAA